MLQHVALDFPQRPGDPHLTVLKKPYHEVSESMSNILTTLVGRVSGVTLSRYYWPEFDLALADNHRLKSLVWSCGHAADLTRFVAGKSELCKFSVHGYMRGAASSGRELAAALAGCSRLQHLGLRVFGDSESSVSLMVALAQARKGREEVRSLILSL